MATAITPIVQTISTVPALRHRSTVNPTSQADKDDFVIKYEANNDHLAAITTLEINTLRTQLNTSVGQINLVADGILDAHDNAIIASTSAAEALDSKEDAAQSENNAKAYQDTSEIYRDESLSNKDLALTYKTASELAYNNTESLLSTLVIPETATYSYAEADARFMSETENFLNFKIGE